MPTRSASPPPLAPAPALLPAAPLADYPDLSLLSPACFDSTPPLFPLLDSPPPKWLTTLTSAQGSVPPIRSAICLAASLAALALPPLCVGELESASPGPTREEFLPACSLTMGAEARPIASSGPPTGSRCPIELLLRDR